VRRHLRWAFFGREALTILISAVLCLVAGCSSHSAQLSPDANPRKALLSAIMAKNNARSFRAKSIEMSPGLDSTIEGEYVAPDKYHVVSRAKVADQTSGSMETIMLGDDFYQKSTDGEWKKLLNAGRITLTILLDENVVDMLHNARDDEVKLVGTDDLDGSRMFVYQMLSFKAWIGAADGLPHRTEAEVSIGAATCREITTFYDYNADIRIQPPRLSL
jgi:hypothetical protein